MSMAIAALRKSAASPERVTPDIYFSAALSTARCLPRSRSARLVRQRISLPRQRAAADD